VGSPLPQGVCGGEAVGGAAKMDVET
jgi:hypothetical protein